MSGSAERRQVRAEAVGSGEIPHLIGGKSDRRAENGYFSGQSWAGS